MTAQKLSFVWIRAKLVSPLQPPTASRLIVAPVGWFEADTVVYGFTGLQCTTSPHSSIQCEEIECSVTQPRRDDVDSPLIPTCVMNVSHPIYHIVSRFVPNLRA